MSRRSRGEMHGHSGYPARTIGSCYACGGPCTRENSTRVKDRAVGVRRLVHRIGCADRFAVQSTPKIEGSNDDA